MKNFRLLTVCLLILGVVAFCSQAHADLALGFSTDGTTFDNSFDVDVGESITVLVLALESDGETRLSEFGLQNVGTTATYITALGLVSSAEINTQNFDDAGSGFNNAIPDLDLLGFSFSPENNAASEILLGAFTFDATAEGTTSFNFGDFDTNVDASDFILGDGATDLDEDFFGAARDRIFTVDIIAIAIVPEPSGVMLLLCGAGVLFSKRRRTVLTKATKFKQ